MQKEYKGFVYAFFAAFSNATMALFAKLAVDVNTETIVFFRNFICFLVVSCFVFRGKDFLKTNRYGLHLFRAVCGLASVYCYYYALKNLELVNAILLANTSALFIPLVVYVWLSTKIPKRRFLAIFIGFLGVLMILKPGIGGFINTASLIGLLSGLTIATAMVGVRQLTKTEPTEVIIFYFFFLATVVCFFPMLYAWEPINGEMWIYVIGTGIAGTCFQFLLTKAYTYAPASKASCVLYLSVVFGGSYGYFIWGNIPDAWNVFGALLIIMGGMLALWDKKNPISMGKKPKKF